MDNLRKLIVMYADALPAGVRDAFEAALFDLDVDCAASESYDHHPDDESPAVVFVGAPNMRMEPPARDMLVVACSEAEIEGRRRTWLASLQKIGERVGRPGLPAFAEAAGNPHAMKSAIIQYPEDPLARRFAGDLNPDNLTAALAVEKTRADAAEQAAADLEIQLHALRVELDRERTARIAERGRAARAEADRARTEAAIEETRYALNDLRAETRRLVEAAREAAWRARLKAAEGREMAEQFRSGLIWDSANAIYNGESRNALPDGRGVMRFLEGGRERGFYRGEFSQGKRHGFGVGKAADGHTWTGQWANDEAHGYGILETHDGRRMEGEVAPPTDAAPPERNLHVWPEASKDATRAPVHSQVLQSLPPPSGGELAAS